MFHFNHPTKKLGRRAPRIDHRTLKLAKYLTAALPTPPDTVVYSAKAGNPQMFLNDKLGCCAIAGPSHMISVWSGNAGNPVSVTDNDIVTAYEACGQYVPGDPSTDNGCDMLTVAKYFQQTGIGGYTIDAFMSANPQNIQELKAAHWIFGGINLGLDLPLTAQNPTWHGITGRKIWDVPPCGVEGDGSPDSWGGHDVNAVDISPEYMTVESWGELYDLTWAFVSAYLSEVIVFLSKQWLESSGVTPSGFDVNALQSDLADIT